jgi:hypothetical protein
MRTPRPHTPLALLTLTFPAAALGQFLEPQVRTIHTFSAPLPEQLGWAVSPLRDIDGDGASELIIPAPGYLTNVGRIEVRSGRTGAVLPGLSLAGTVAGGRFGHAIADAGRVDADTLHDVIIGSPTPPTSPGRIHIYSATGALIRQVPGPIPGGRFGSAVAGIGDINGDGRSEVIVGADADPANGSNAGRIYILSGLDGSILRTHEAEAPGHRLGAGVTGLADINGDTVPDYAAAAMRGGPSGMGRAYVYSGATGALLLPPLDPDSTALTFGQFFIGDAGDVNRDGKHDIYIGDYADSRAYIFSGATGQRIHTLYVGPSQGLGCGRAAGDIDADGHADLVIGAYTAGAGAPQAGRVFLFSGRDGSILRTITSTTAGENLGFDAVGVGDVDADGRYDFLVGAATASRAYVIAGTHNSCYPNCDASTAAPILNVGDFTCFLQRFAAADAYANCDRSTAPPVLNVGDFTCFLQRFAAGCP